MARARSPGRCYNGVMEILGWIIFVLPFVAIYRLIRSLQAQRDQSRYNPNKQSVDSSVEGGHGGV